MTRTICGRCSVADLVAVRRRSRSDLKVPYSAVRPAPSPRPALPPGRFGDLSATSAEQIAELAASTWPGSSGVRNQRRAGARDLLLHLADFAGETWTQRWIASGLDAPAVAELERADEEVIQNERPIARPSANP